ncbi:MAG: hypothetical protein ACYDCS_09090 [Candidatus Dormibacteria bacterium]
MSHSTRGSARWSATVRATLAAVSKILGYVSLTTTQRHIDHLQLAELRAAVPAG